MRLASRFGYANQIRRDRPLTHEELMHYVPGIFGEDKHTSRSQNYTYNLHQWPSLRSVDGRSPGATPGKRGGQCD